MQKDKKKEAAIPVCSPGNRYKGPRNKNGKIYPLDETEWSQGLSNVSTDKARVKPRLAFC